MSFLKFEVGSSENRLGGKKKKVNDVENKMVRKRQKITILTSPPGTSLMMIAFIITLGEIM